MSESKIFSSESWKRFNTSLRQLSKIHSGITLVCIEDSNLVTSLINNEESILLTDAHSYCNILRYRNCHRP